MGVGGRGTVSSTDLKWNQVKEQIQEMPTEMVRVTYMSKIFMIWSQSKSSPTVKTDMLGQLNLMVPLTTVQS